MKKRAGLVILALLLFAGANVSPAEESITKHYEDSLMAMGEKGIFAVELVVPAMGVHMGVNSVEIIIHDASDNDVAGADITLTPWMPKMGHGVSEEARVTERGGGVYTVENIVFSMTGWWDLTVEVRKGDLVDSAVFSFHEITAMGHEVTAEVPKPEELDVSASAVSGEGHFHLAYEAEGGSVPLNAIHSWILELKDSSGRPVTGADITLVGDMPKHGHGFPTEPEVTEELGAGRYRVEGLKFSMPGWWVVTFHVVAGEKRDSTSFNLFLR
jgi:hypothetical protein